MTVTLWTFHHLYHLVLFCLLLRLPLWKQSEFFSPSSFIGYDHALVCGCYMLLLESRLPVMMSFFSPSFSDQHGNHNCRFRNQSGCCKGNLWPTLTKGGQSRWEDHDKNGEDNTYGSFHEFIVFDFFSHCRVSIPVSYSDCSQRILRTGISFKKTASRRIS